MVFRQDILYLLQVALPFALLGIWKNPLFFIPVAIILLSLPFAILRTKLIAGWQWLGHTMGRIVSPIVLSLLYYFALTPLALLRRLIGSDSLQLKRPATSTLKEISEKNSHERFDDLW